MGDLEGLFLRRKAGRLQRDVVACGDHGEIVDPVTQTKTRLEFAGSQASQRLRPELRHPPGHTYAIDAQIDIHGGGRTLGLPGLPDRQQRIDGLGLVGVIDVGQRRWWQRAAGAFEGGGFEIDGIQRAGIGAVEKALAQRGRGKRIEPDRLGVVEAVIVDIEIELHPFAKECAWRMVEKAFQAFQIDRFQRLGWRGFAAVEQRRTRRPRADRGTGRVAPVAGEGKDARIRLVGVEIAWRERLHGLFMHEPRSKGLGAVVAKIGAMHELQRLAHDWRGRQAFAAVHVLAEIADIEAVACGSERLQEQQSVVVANITVAQARGVEHHVEGTGSVLTRERVVVHAQHADHTKRHGA